MKKNVEIFIRSLDNGWTLGHFLLSKGKTVKKITSEFSRERGNYGK
jgi:hypothetical protein